MPGGVGLGLVHGSTSMSAMNSMLISFCQCSCGSAAPSSSPSACGCGCGCSSGHAKCHGSSSFAFFSSCFSSPSSFGCACDWGCWWHSSSARPAYEVTCQRWSLIKAIASFSATQKVLHENDMKRKTINQNVCHQLPSEWSHQYLVRVSASLLYASAGILISLRPFPTFAFCRLLYPWKGN